MIDRRIHARTPVGNEIVRYDRSGKWYVESAQLPRQRITIAQAVAFAIGSGAEVNLGLPGGKAFDAKFAAAMRTDKP